MYISDNHAHINEVKGLGALEVGTRFKRAGGSLIVVVSLLTWSIGEAPGSKDGVVKLYEMTIKSVQKLRSLGVRALAVLGFHPAECSKLYEIGWSVEEVEEFARWAIDLAGRYIREGRAVGIGEVGRPHWPAPRELVELCNRVMEYAISIAKDLGAVVHLHLERGGSRTVEDVHRIVSRVGARKHSVILHHAEPKVLEMAYQRGLIASIPAKTNELKEALRHEPVFLIESDYLDDRSRPGAVVPPWTLARKLVRMVENGEISEETLYRICFENMRVVYGDVVE